MRPRDASAQAVWCVGNDDATLDFVCGVGFANKTDAEQSNGPGAAPSATLVRSRCCERIFCALEHCDPGYELVSDACCGRQRIPSIGVAANNTICCERTLVLEEFVLDLANAMAGQLGTGFLMLLDVLPHAGSALSCIAGMYVIVSNKLQEDDAAVSLLEEVFSLAAGCTGMASLISLMGIRMTADMADGGGDSAICQIEGAGVTYFQLCTVLWLTAGANSVYKFVC
eukprot:COSAG06_NODE_16146_length_1018_cov_1.016304_1_plen_226_part_10